jgi:hypothetical protein
MFTYQGVLVLYPPAVAGIGFGDMIYITEVRMSEDGGHIVAVRWQKDDSPEATGESTVEEMIDWIERAGGSVHVRFSEGLDDPLDVPVAVVNADRRYLRALKDGNWPDTLLSLPRYGVRQQQPKRE